MTTHIISEREDAVTNVEFSKSASHGVDTLPSPVLAASWERSMRHGLRREDKALFTAGVSRKASKSFEEENRLLRDHATPEMRKLYGGLSSPRWLALCMNATGRIVCSVGDRTSAPAELRILMQPGRSLTESELGTTAPGCALAEQRSVIVERGEHFLFELRDFVCASAPIFGPTGSLAGGLDISGIQVEALPLASDMIGFAVRRIENSMLSALDECVLLKFHCDDRLIGTPMEGILAVDSDGAIRGFNRGARQLLSLPGNYAIGDGLDSLFEGGLGRILRCANKEVQRVSIRSLAGPAAFVSVEHRSRVVHGTATQTPRTPLQTPNAPAFVIRDVSLNAGYTKAARILSHGLPVLLQGETGTGKEVIARALHAATRPNTRFIAVNCAAIPENLIESELFGYIEGSFTGARKGGASGKIEQADGGVLFLDEIGDMPLAMQTRLLRVLQERSVTRIGSSIEVSLDLSIICATHHVLAQLVADGRFREDLYYRLNGHTLRIPPLREREDLRELVVALLQRWSDSVITSAADLRLVITERALARITEYSWPGNVRQLEHAIRALLALRTHDPIDVDELPDFLQPSTEREPAILADEDAAHSGNLMEAAQLETIRAVLQEHRGNISSTARALGISRGTLYSKLKLSRR